MKFKSDIEVQAGLRDGGNDIGTAGQLLSSTGTVTNWIDQGDVVAAGATRVLIACKNTSGGTITKGTPVYQTGNVGATDVIEVAEADALISTGYLPAIGLLETDLINNAFGHVVITGELLNITTSPIDGVVPVTGDTVYLKSGGGLTLTKPTGEGNAIQNLGLVGKVSGGNAGSLTVSSIMRQNDVPNLPEGRIWIGDGNTIVSDTVYVDEPNNRVGIGTTTPSTDLEVSSTGVNGVDISQSASNASQSGRLFFTTNTASEGFALFNSNGTFQVNSGGIPNNTSGTNRISIIGSSGNVGIGTTSPTAKLDVYGNLRVGTTGTFTISQSPFSTTVFYVGAGNGSTITFGAPASNTQDVSVQGDLYSYQGSIGTKLSGSFNNKITYNGDNYLNSGNLGIGTTSPQEKLHVIEEVPGTTLIEVENTRTNSNAGIKLSSGQTNYNVAFTNANGDFQIYNSSTAKEEITIAANGKVGIGATSPSEKLDVDGNVKANNYINQRVAWNSGFNHGSNNAASYYFIPVGYIAESTADTYYNNWIAPYAGRVRKIVLRNTGQSTVPTATTVNFRVSVNGSVVHTGSTITVTGSGLNILASETLSDSTAVFSATDRVQVAYRTNGLWRNVAAGISLEYTE